MYAYYPSLGGRGRKTDVDLSSLGFRVTLSQNYKNGLEWAR